MKKMRMLVLTVLSLMGLRLRLRLLLKKKLKLVRMVGRLTVFPRRTFATCTFASGVL
jgi:hypothetical protein